MIDETEDRYLHVSSDDDPEWVGAAGEETGRKKEYAEAPAVLNRSIPTGRTEGNGSCDAEDARIIPFHEKAAGRKCTVSHRN